MTWIQTTGINADPDPKHWPQLWYVIRLKSTLTVRRICFHIFAVINITVNIRNVAIKKSAQDVART